MELRTFGWRVARIAVGSTWEYLDHNEDKFDPTPKFGFASKAEALVRAQKYVGDERLRIVSPGGVGYGVPMSKRPNPNYQFNELITREAHIRFETDPNKLFVMMNDFKSLMRAFIGNEGLWCLSSVLHTKRLFELITTYNIITPTELAELVKRGKSKV